MERKHAMKWNIKKLGRMAEDAEGTLWLCSPASEISFRVRNASFLTLTLCWNGTCPESTFDRIWPRYAVYLDGEKILDTRQDGTGREVRVFGPEDGGGKDSRTVRLVKLSECSHSLIGLKAIRTDGTTEALPDRKPKMEFIGDSITCGYGVEGRAEDTFSTETENAEKSHAFLTARALGADAVLTAYSGCGLLSGYTDGDINEGNLMIPVYEKTGRIPWALPGGRTPQEIPWNFESFRPDWIVIQLGNNDLSWTRGIPEREEQFLTRYEAFLAMVRKNNPNARILCALGIDGEPLVGCVEKAVENRRAGGDPLVRFVRLPQMDEQRDGAGADHHPSEKFQRDLSKVLLCTLGEWMNA